MKFHCPHCDKSLNIGDENTGRKARCPRCKGVFTIPTLPEYDPALTCPSCGAEMLSESSECTHCGFESYIYEPGRKANIMPLILAACGGAVVAAIIAVVVVGFWTSDNKSENDAPRTARVSEEPKSQRNEGTSNIHTASSPSQPTDNALTTAEPGAGEPNDKVRITSSFPPGRYIINRVAKQKNRIEQVGQAQEFSFTADSVAELVVFKGINGIKKGRMRLKRLRLDVGTYQVDTDNLPPSSKEANLVYRVLKELMKSEIDLSFTEKDAIHSVRGLDKIWNDISASIPNASPLVQKLRPLLYTEQTVMEFAMDPRMQPRHSVRVGDTWPYSRVLPLGGQLGQRNISGVCKLVEIKNTPKGRLARIEVAGQDDEAPSSNGSASLVSKLDLKVAFVVTINLDTGPVVETSADMSGQIKIAVNGPDGRRFDRSVKTDAEVILTVAFTPNSFEDRSKQPPISVATSSHKENNTSKISQSAPKLLDFVGTWENKDINWILRISPSGETHYSVADRDGHHMGFTDIIESEGEFFFWIGDLKWKASLNHDRSMLLVDLITKDPKHPIKFKLQKAGTTSIVPAQGLVSVADILDKGQRKAANIQILWAEDFVPREQTWRWPQLTYPNEWERLKVLGERYGMKFKVMKESKIPIPEGRFRTVVVELAVGKGHRVFDPAYPYYEGPILLVGQLLDVGAYGKGNPGDPKEHKLTGKTLYPFATECSSLGDYEGGFVPRGGGIAAMLETYEKAGTAKYLFFVGKDIHEFTLLPHEKKPIRFKLP